ncbi:hypothetical protein AVEN_249575-1 [Araneus ventricosus]|uniref:Integrase catalytic domain-containing protein n=1 Tax=Araneus ventricosus TaxID=182803 RepID=A0A4Y2MDS1_ARAVE|nr:hypothetical protein AVEN_249575-1 [Araneus ventricosus]
MKSRLKRYNVGTPLERAPLDILAPFPVTTKGNHFVLVLMDYFTKWPEAIPISNQETSSVPEEIVRKWISCFSLSIISFFYLEPTPVRPTKKGVMPIADRWGNIKAIQIYQYDTTHTKASSHSTER